MERRINYCGPGIVGHQIRLLEVYPRLMSIPTVSESEMLRCRLETYDRGSCPRYRALSYAWQHADSTLPIMINDAICEVAETVEKALRQLRHSRRMIRVWVDQICINQDDNVEKAQQVQQMHHIYGEADVVDAWLGMPSHGTGLLFQFLEQMGNAILKRQWKRLARSINEINFPSLGEAFKVFCDRPYWKRLWIMQEFALCRRVRIVCGDLAIGVDSLTAAFTMSEASEESRARRVIPKAVMDKMTKILYPQERSFVDNVISRRQRFRPFPGSTGNEGDHLFRVVVTCLVLELDHNWPIASDTRDRVFALMNLAFDVRDFDEKFVDYSKSPEQVYHDTTVAFLNQGHVDVLSYCQFPKRLDSLPSWVVDWSMEVRNPSVQAPWFCKFEASGPAITKQHAVYPQPGSITLHGVSVDTIKEYGSIWDPSWTEPLDDGAAARFIRDILRLCQEAPRTRSGEELLDAIRIATVDGAYFSDMGTERDLIEYLNIFIEGSRRFVPTTCQDGHNGDGRIQDEDDEDNWYSQALHRLHSRRPFLTSTGFVGLCPSHVAVDDVVCIFHGGKTPYVLRPQSNSTYILIGETYVHGIMYGEFMKGKPVSKIFTLI